MSEQGDSHGAGVLIGQAMRAQEAGDSERALALVKQAHNLIYTSGMKDALEYVHDSIRLLRAAGLSADAILAVFEAGTTKEILDAVLKDKS